MSSTSAVVVVNPQAIRPLWPITTKGTAGRGRRRLFRAAASSTARDTRSPERQRRVRIVGEQRFAAGAVTRRRRPSCSRRNCGPTICGSAVKRVERQPAVDRKHLAPTSSAHPLGIRDRGTARSAAEIGRAIAARSNSPRKLPSSCNAISLPQTRLSAGRHGRGKSAAAEIRAAVRRGATRERR